MYRSYFCRDPCVLLSLCSGVLDLGMRLGAPKRIFRWRAYLSTGPSRGGAELSLVVLRVLKNMLRANHASQRLSTSSSSPHPCDNMAYSGIFEP